MRITQINTESDFYTKFNLFVAKHSLLFHSPAWVANYNDQQLIQCAIVNKNDDIIGGFIYYSFKKYSFKFIITPPFTPNIELFYINPAESVVGKNSFTKDVLALISEYFDGLKVHYININLPYHIIDSQPFIWKGYTSRTRFSYLIDVSQSPEDLWNNLSSEKRKSINKAVKDELVIKESSDLSLIYELVYKSLDRNSKAKNLNILKNILFKFSNQTNSFAFVAYKNEKAIGATFCLISGLKAVYLFGGFDSDNKHHGAGVSCIWQSVLKAKALGLTHFDFEGSMNISIERYFREFGGELHSYACIEKVKPLLSLLLSTKKHNLA